MKKTEEEMATIGLIVVIVAIAILTIIFVAMRAKEIKQKRSEVYQEKAKMEASNGDYEAALESMEEAQGDNPEAQGVLAQLSGLSKETQALRNYLQTVNDAFPETKGLGISGIYMGGENGYTLSVDEVCFTFYGLEPVVYVITNSDIFNLRDSAAKNVGFETITFNNDYTLVSTDGSSTGGVEGSMNIVRISLSDYNPFTANHADTTVAEERKSAINQLINHMIETDVNISDEVIDQVMK